MFCLVGDKMHIKQLIKFYMSADSLNAVFDNIIMNAACSSAYCPGEGQTVADKIITYIDEKNKLSVLWEYIDKVFNSFTEEEKEVLENYGRLRTGLSRFDNETVKEIKRVTIKFKRRLRNLDRFTESLQLVTKYRCLMTV